LQNITDACKFYIIGIDYIC